MPTFEMVVNFFQFDIFHIYAECVVCAPDDTHGWLILDADDTDYATTSGHLGRNASTFF